MDVLKQFSIDEMMKAREALLSIPKDNNLNNNINAWFNDWDEAFARFDSVRGGVGTFQMLWTMYRSFHSVNDIEVLNALRSSMVEVLDKRVRIFDTQITIRSILEQCISRISDTKLATVI